MDRSHVVVAAWMFANHEDWELMEPQPRHDARLSQQNGDDYEVDTRLVYHYHIAWVDGADDASYRDGGFPATSEAIAGLELDAAAADAYRDGGFGAVPATSEAIAALREISIGEAVRERECTVCMEGFVAGDKLRAMPCSHCFHERCIFDWLRVSGICPLCRHRLPSEQP